MILTQQKELAMKILRQARAAIKHWPPRYPQIAATVLAGLMLLSTGLWLFSGANDLPDMQAYAAGGERKAAFIDFLTPVIETQNKIIREQRDNLLEIASTLEADGEISWLAGRRLNSLAEQYRVETEDTVPTNLVAELKLRIDEVPLSLVLVQAAKESGWGTSKFARVGNNLFGQWCFSEGCGIVPSKRSSGAKHEVRVFDSVDAAVAAYFHNINSGRSYRQLRDLRAAARKAGRGMDSISLADGLLFYSQRRQAYVDEVKLMIHQYKKFQRSRSG